MRFATLLLALLLSAAAGAQQDTYVANQGNFSEGNGSLTALDPFGDPNDVTQLFEGTLGSILQSATRYENTLYLVSNSANRVDIVDLSTNARVGQITGGFSSPRYLAFIDYSVNVLPSKAYVSNQVYDGGSSFVLPVDLDARTTGEPIPVEGLPEAITLDPFRGDKAYVALGAFGPDAGGVDSVAVLDPQSDAVLRYIDIGCYARFVQAVAFDGVVLAFCEDTDEAVVIDSNTDSVVQRIAFDEEIGDPFNVGQSVGPGRPIELATRRSTPASSTVFVATASGVAEVGPTHRNGEFGILRTIPIPEADTRPISAVSLSGFDFRLVLGRPDPDNPFTADGTITTHDYDDGTLEETYPAGIYPVHIAIDEQFPVATADAPGGADVALALAGPNPARGRTALAVTLDRPARATVTLYDVLGRPALVLDRGALAAGTHRLDLDVSALPAGLYLARLVSEGGAADVAVTVAR